MRLCVRACFTRFGAGVLGVFCARCCGFFVFPCRQGQGQGGGALERRSARRAASAESSRSSAERLRRGRRRKTPPRFGAAV